MKRTDSLLGFALLGLLREQPRSGYDLRKVFAETAMGSFSDSPGAIYPALKRLEERGMVRGTVEDAKSLRPRRILRATPKGTAAFRAWLKRPITRDDVIRRMGELMLRFAFLDDELGPEEAAKFLGRMGEELESYVPSLRLYLKGNAEKMPLSARLALECGVAEYEARLQWTRTGRALMERKRKRR